MEAGMKSAVRADADAWSLPRSRSRGRPCSRACTLSGMEAGVESGTDTDTRSSVRHARCPLGFSEMQIAILSVLKARPPIIAYWQIAEKVASGYGLAATEGAVRGALERLYRRGFLIRSRAAAGKAQGNRYGFASEPCPHISPYTPIMEFGTDPDMEPVAQSGENAVRSILEEKIDRKNLSISSGEDENLKTVHKLEALTEDDVAYHWPNLAKAGFGTCQIRQIVHRLPQVDMGLENIMQGLTHAEWELENGAMRDKSGQQVSKPVDWVFSILAKQGYYRRPEGYVSPQEQAELDAAEEEKRTAAAHETRKKAAFDAWLAGLPPEERASITAQPGSAIKLPEDTALRLHFKSEIWPKILAQS